MIGTWIDGLTDEQRDRIIEGQGWITGDMIFGSSRCLVSHAYALSEDSFGAPELMAPGAVLSLDYICDIACRFDALVARFDYDRIVRACKMRAARSAIVAPAEPANAAQS